MPKRHIRAFSLIERLTLLSYSSLLLLWVATVIGFAIVYYTLSFFPGMHSLYGLADLQPMERFFNALYFSVITSTTVGYGDLTPQGISKLFAAVQSVSGFFIAALFVAKLVAYRQEVTLERVYELTFQAHVQSIRENFYLIRKDLDAAMREMEQEKALTVHAWDNLGTAFRQARSLLEEVLGFYATDQHAHTIDPKREILLLDAVNRTVQRLRHLLEGFDRHGVEWRRQKGIAAELQAMLAAVESTLGQWQELSPHETEDHFRALSRELQETRRMTGNKKIR